MLTPIELQSRFLETCRGTLKELRLAAEDPTTPEDLRLARDLSGAIEAAVKSLREVAL